MADYFSFDDVMRELELGEDELKRMVSEGELRAFRDENKMKFRKEDVENLKKGRQSEPTLILPSEGSDIVSPDETGETLLDLEGGGAADLSLSDTGAPVAGKGKGETGGVTEEMVFSDQDFNVDQEVTEVGIDAADTFIEEDVEDTGLTTEPLQVSDAAGTVTEEVTVVDDGAKKPAAAAGPKKPVMGARRAAPKRRAAVGALPPNVEAEVERRRPHWIWTIFLFLTVASSGLTGLFFFDLFRVNEVPGPTTKPLEFTGNWGASVLEKFYTDNEYLGYMPAAIALDETLKRRMESIVPEGKIPYEYRFPIWQVQDRLLKGRQIVAEDVGNEGPAGGGTP